MIQNKVRILIVDDMEENVNAFKAVISAHISGLELLTAQNGSEALELVKERSFDVIILDVQMPDMDGFEVCQLLKKNDQTAHIPILMVSAMMTHGSYRAKGIDAGADGYLCKPFDNIELVAQINSLIRLKRSEDALREQTRKLEEALGQSTTTLRNREQQWHGLFKASPDAIFIEDQQGTVLEANPAACVLHNMTHDELVGKNVINLVPPDERKKVEKHFSKWVARSMHTYEGVSYTKDGKKIPVEVRATPFEYEGKPSLLLHVRNISDRTQMKKERMQASKLESVGILAGGIAHDFNNILTGIIGNISFAKIDMDEDSAVYKPICDAEKSAFRARLLTQQLLTFAQGGSPVRKTASVKELLEETAAFVMRGSKSVCIFDFEENLWPADIDVGQISQVIENLVINASQSMPTGGTICITAKNMIIDSGKDSTDKKLKNGRYLEICVKDGGIGISPDCLERIFDPYFTTKKEGNGLGLATSYSIITKHGGSISVESTLNRGTSFSLFIPASEKQLPKIIKVSEEPIKGEGNILVMDDEGVIRDLAEVLLEKLGYTVFCVADGSAALTAYQKAMRAKNPFDAVILDITVPGGMGGIEAVELLQAIDPDVKAIVSSGYTTRNIMSVPERLGFKGVLTKPYNIQQLSAVVHDVLSE